MSWYGVKNEQGDWLSDDGTAYFSGDAHIITRKSDADWMAKSHGGHVVELVEAPAKVVVSEEEAEMLKEAVKDDNFGAGFISDYVDEHWDDYGSLNRTHIQDRLMRAYVNGWTVEKLKRYGVFVPYVEGKMYFKNGRENDELDIASADCLNESNQQFTLAEIEHYGLGDCERVEVCADSARTTGEVTDHE